jgi:plasmid maintenance system antidote protein VapI
MHNPPHPGEFIIQVYLDPNNLSSRELAGKLGKVGKVRLTAA